MSRLQAETDQVATGLRRAAAPLAGNPFSKISEISERASSSWSSGVGKVKGASERLSGVLVGLGKLAPYVRQGGQALGNGLALLGREASKRVAGPMADVSSKVLLSAQRCVCLLPWESFSPGSLACILVSTRGLTLVRFELSESRDAISPPVCPVHLALLGGKN